MSIYWHNQQIKQNCNVFYMTYYFNRSTLNVFSCVIFTSQTVTLVQLLLGVPRFQSRPMRKIFWQGFSTFESLAKEWSIILLFCFLSWAYLHHRSYLRSRREERSGSQVVAPSTVFRRRNILYSLAPQWLNQAVDGCVGNSGSEDWLYMGIDTHCS